MSQATSLPTSGHRGTSRNGKVMPPPPPVSRCTPPAALPASTIGTETQPNAVECTEFRTMAHRVGGLGIALGALEGFSGLLLLSGIAPIPPDEAIAAAFISWLVAAVLVSAGVASYRKCVAGFYVLLGLSSLYLLIAVLSLIAGMGFVGIIPAMIALYLFNAAPRAIALAKESQKSTTAL